MSFKGHNHVPRFDGSTEHSWHAYTCAHCSTAVTGAVVGSYENVHGPIKWLLCTNCADGSVLTRKDIVYPIVTFGPKIEGLPSEVSDAYNEARNCMSIAAYTSCELICRKILMHVAVDKGAEEGETFVNYLTYLEGKGYVTPPMKSWVDLIRMHGNESTHELPSPDKSRAENTIMFTAELLILIYQMEHIARRYTHNPTQP